MMEACLLYSYDGPLQTERRLDDLVDLHSEDACQ
jgi:hypothetical protein